MQNCFFFFRKKRLRHAAQTEKADFRHDSYTNMHKFKYIAENVINVISLAFGVIENPQDIKQMHTYPLVTAPPGVKKCLQMIESRLFCFLLLRI